MCLKSHLQSSCAIRNIGVNSLSLSLPRCEQREDGTYTFHYYSSRRNYHPLVKGLINAVAREIFYKRVDIELISTEEEDLGVDRKQEHNTFYLKIYDGDRQTPPLSPPCSSQHCYAVHGNADVTFPAIYSADKTESHTFSSPTASPKSPVLSLAENGADCKSGRETFNLLKKTGEISAFPSKSMPNSKEHRLDAIADKIGCPWISDGKGTEIHETQVSPLINNTSPCSSTHLPRPISQTAFTHTSSPFFAKPTRDCTNSSLHYRSSPICPFGPLPARNVVNKNSVPQNSQQPSTPQETCSPKSQSSFQDTESIQLENGLRIQSSIKTMKPGANSHPLTPSPEAPSFPTLNNPNGAPCTVNTWGNSVLTDGVDGTIGSSEDQPP
ncbi:guanylate cyclase soluble subunit beta-2 [Elysia marginata]|uniref:Guanylate cyclase soluble subunit beta-2 n=1 Tax=Elysia marginata TaxID=1093978 RepID=A0AAV4JWX7_9GAST|nr:guanylate cyclase soluble subunit beta-2 [Elysia marginata]